MKRLSCPSVRGQGGRLGRSVLRCGNVAWLIVAWTWSAVVPARAVSAQRVSEVRNPVVLQAIDAYDSGDLARALGLLEDAPASLPAAEAAVRALFTGLIHFAQGNATRAHESFVLAVRLDASASLDSNVHAPSRIRAFERARNVVVAQWRSRADEAMAAGDTTSALELWRSVLEAIPGDSTSQSRIDDVEEARRLAEAARAAAAAAEDSLRQRLRAVPDTIPATTDPSVPAAAATRVYNPGQALAMGMVVPGLGQMYTGRRGLGILSLAAAGGAAAAGVLFERVSIDCRIQPVNGTCPAADILEEHSDRPYLIAGVASAAAVTLIAALDGFFAARRANERAAMRQARGSGTGVDIGPELQVGRRTVLVEWARIRF